MLAKRIRVRANDVLKAESERGHLRKLHQAFKDNLIADLTPDGFADMFAQTIAYGLFTAQVSRGSGALVADNVVDMVPSTNPFLRDLLNDFLTAAGRARQRDKRVDFDELGINDVVETLRHAPMDDILRSFNSDRPGEDPVIHFYEDFLKAYDKKMRAQRGVFYTPRPVVQFIVRSVHEILQTEFGIEDGLASTITWGEMRRRRPELALPAHATDDMPFVQVLDPATGTGTFLVEIIDLVYAHMRAKWAKRGLVTREQIKAPWNDYVRHHLLPRLHGFELMMAPYAIAHMKIGLKLVETDYAFPKDGPRVNVFLTNALQPAHDVQRDLEGMAPMLAREATSANRTKERLAATVVIGNPPYAGHSANNNVPSIVDAVYDYKRGYADLRKPGQAKWLQNDYVKFIRFGERRLASAGAGVLGYITDHSYLDNPTFKGMRRHLCGSFPWMRLVNLHGNSKKKERTPDGGKDESVFEITQGTAVGLFARGPWIAASRNSADVWGVAPAKYADLSATALHGRAFEPLEPNEPFWLFVRQAQEGRESYESGWPLPTVFDRNGDPAPGFATQHDEFAVSWDAQDAESKISALLETHTEAEARELFTLCAQVQWNYANAVRDLSTGEWRRYVIKALYRPFDTRTTVFDRNVAVHRRLRASAHFLAGENLGLAVSRQGQAVNEQEWRLVFVTRSPTELNLFRRGGNYLLPLWLFGGQPHRTDLHDDDLISELPGRTANLNPAFIAALCDAMRLAVTDWRPENGSDAVHAAKVFHYIYAVLHSPAYRSRYAAFLRIDFPRIPLPGSRNVFNELAELGEQLVQWHLLEHPTAVSIATTSAPTGVSVPAFAGADRKLLKVAEKSRELADIEMSTEGPLGTIFINPTSGFTGVRQAVWQHTIGGYQVLHKWLDDRRKAQRSLSDDDIAHWRRVYAALEATQCLMRQVDEAIEAHGGWPTGDGSGGAFSLDHPPPDPVALAADAAARPKGRRKPVSAAQPGLGFDGGHDAA